MCYSWDIDDLAGDNVDTEVTFTTDIDKLSFGLCSSNSGRVRGFNDLGTRRTGYWISFLGEYQIICLKNTTFFHFLGAISTELTNFRAPDDQSTQTPR